MNSVKILLTHITRLYKLARIIRPWCRISGERRIWFFSILVVGLWTSIELEFVQKMKFFLKLFWPEFKIKKLMTSEETCHTAKTNVVFFIGKMTICKGNCFPPSLEEERNSNIMEHHFLPSLTKNAMTHWIIFSCVITLLIEDNKAWVLFLLKDDIHTYLQITIWHLSKSSSS